MIIRRIVCMMGVCLLAGHAKGYETRDSDIEKQREEYVRVVTEIQSLESTFMPGPVNNLADYERFADDLQAGWVQKDRELYARVMLAICGPLSSGRFSGDREREVARRYALSALDEPNEISLQTELELVGHVVTRTSGLDTPKGAVYEEARRKDMEVRLHAWRRLLDAIDMTWDPNDRPRWNVSPPAGAGIEAGMASGAIEDPALRTEYEQTLEANRQKNERHIEQRNLRQWLSRYLPTAEKYITSAYSIPPYNSEELTVYLNAYRLNDEAKSRILATVIQNIEIQQGSGDTIRD